MSYEEVVKRNQHQKIDRASSRNFQKYGRIYEYAVDEAINYALNNISHAKDFYQASYEGLESIPIIQTISADLFGGLPVQAGPCTGYNKALTGFEYHQGSEVIIAATDCVIILGKREDMEGNTYQSEKVELFYVEKGQVIELYGTTLHYTPCNVEDFFMTTVLLLKGTNEAVEKPNGICIKKNKYFITHPSQTEKVEAGNYPGLLGEMIHIN